MNNLFETGCRSMTDFEMNEITRLRSQGQGYKRIAATLGLSWNTVKSFCQRSKDEVPSTENHCKQCNTVLTQTPHKRKKVFCSDKCRIAWWNANPELIKGKELKKDVCEVCGSTFVSYASKHKKYCSRSCYDKARTRRC